MNTFPQGIVSRKLHEQAGTSHCWAKGKKSMGELALYGAHEGECDFGPPCKEGGRPTGVCTKHAAAFREREMGMNLAMKELLVMIDVINEAGTETEEGKETT